MKKIRFTRKVIRTEVVLETVVLTDAEVDLPEWLLDDRDMKSDDEEYQEKLSDYVWDEGFSGYVEHDEWIDTCDVQCEEIFDIEVEL